MTVHSVVRAPIAVIGPGAIGSLFAAYLARAGYPVTLFGRSPEGGLTPHERVVVEEASEEVVWQAALETPAPADWPGRFGLVWVCVKAYATAAVAPLAADLLAAGGLVVTVQNGLGNAETLAEAAGAERVLVGTTGQGAIRLGPGRARHTGAGPTRLGRFQGDPQPAREVVALLDAAGLPAELAPDWRQVVWSKLVVNAALNPVAALTRRRNGEVLAHESATRLVERLAGETVAAARASGVALDPVAALEELRRVAAATARNLNSMLQDVLAGRPTEIEAISGAVLRVAAEHGLDLPATAAVYALVRALEDWPDRDLPPSPG